MEKKIKLLAPSCAKVNFIFFELSSKCFNPNHSIPVTDLNEEEAIQFGELMKQTFINHWKEKQNETMDSKRGLSSRKSG